VYVETSAMVVAAAAAVVVTACGQPPSESPAATASVAAAQPVTAVASVATPPPNAQGDPACPGSTAWGRDPGGVGVLVTYWSDAPSGVTVLVRTVTGSDRAQRATVDFDELHFFEFPDIDNTTVREVLLMTDTRRCFVVADPDTFG
jgi:hypothetical protein